jgi:hypothetical protein
MDSVLLPVGDPLVTELPLAERPSFKAAKAFVGQAYESPSGDIAIVIGYEVDWHSAENTGIIRLTVQQMKPNPAWAVDWRVLYPPKRFPRNFAFA